MKKTYFFILLILIPLAQADNNFYAISGNVFISNDYKIYTQNNIINDILIDNESVYFYNNKMLYFVNKTTGIVNFNIFIQNIESIKQTDNFIYVKKSNEILKINKLTGISDTKTVFTKTINNIYSYFMGVSSLSGNSNISDNTKVNKSGDWMTGSIFANRDNKSIGSLSYVDLSRVSIPSRTIMFIGLNRIYNETSMVWENGSYINDYGLAAVYDTTTKNGSNEPFLRIAQFQPGSLSYTYPVTLGNKSINFKKLSGTTNAIVSTDSSGELGRDTINGYVSGDVFICYNSTVGLYAC